MDWRELLGAEKSRPYFVEMMRYVAERRASGVTVYPPKEDVFNAFSMTPLDQVKVVIIGQDPYHGAGQAHGLCFSVQPGIKVPPSLVNIYKELDRDFDDFKVPQHGDLSSWAEQGVLLLNTVLTVEDGNAHSHAKIGWEQFTDVVIEQLNAAHEGLVFLLWGGHAKKKAAKVDRAKHHILTAPHPSPLSAHRGFIGCGHFSQCNEYLEAKGKSPIHWQV